MAGQFDGLILLGPLLGGWSKKKQKRKKLWVRQWVILARGSKKELTFPNYWYHAHDTYIIWNCQNGPGKSTKESAGTTLCSQFSFLSAQLHQNLKFHWLSGALDSF
jgi:hypothetical protein